MIVQQAQRQLTAQLIELCVEAGLAASQLAGQLALHARGKVHSSRQCRDQELGPLLKQSAQHRVRAGQRLLQQRFRKDRVVASRTEMHWHFEERGIFVRPDRLGMREEHCAAMHGQLQFVQREKQARHEEIDDHGRQVQAVFCANGHGHAVRLLNEQLKGFAAMFLMTTACVDGCAPSNAADAGVGMASVLQDAAPATTPGPGPNNSPSPDAASR